MGYQHSKDTFINENFHTLLDMSFMCHTIVIQKSYIEKIVTLHEVRKDERTNRMAIRTFRWKC